MRFLLKFSYDGSNYAGFQNQPGLNTIQFQLEEALKKVNDNKNKSCFARFYVSFSLTVQRFQTITEG